MPQDLLEQLRAGADHHAFGEARLGLGRTMQRLSRQTLVWNFGAEAARSILAVDDDRWHGPLESVQGVHFVRIVRRTSPIQLTYEDVAGYVEAE